jgi:hypothetical protein
MVRNMNENERILMRDAVQQGEIVIAKIAELYADPSEQEWLSIAEHLAAQGFLEQVRPGTYRTTESGRTTWNSIEESAHQANRAEVIRRNPPWQPA